MFLKKKTQLLSLMKSVRACLLKDRQPSLLPTDSRSCLVRVDGHKSPFFTTKSSVKPDQRVFLLRGKETPLAQYSAPSPNKVMQQRNDCAKLMTHPKSFPQANSFIGRPLAVPTDAGRASGCLPWTRSAPVSARPPPFGGDGEATRTFVARDNRAFTEDLGSSAWVGY